MSPGNIEHPPHEAEARAASKGDVVGTQDTGAWPDPTSNAGAALLLASLLSALLIAPTAQAQVVASPPPHAPLVVSPPPPPPVDTADCPPSYRAYWTANGASLSYEAILRLLSATPTACGALRSEMSARAAYIQDQIRRIRVRPRDVQRPAPTVAGQNVQVPPPPPPDH